MAGRLYLPMLFAILVLAGQASRLTAVPPPPQAPQAGLQPAQRVKRALELQVEQAIETAYRRCFRIYVIAGQRLDLRIPFGQNEERRGSPGFVQRIFLGGKGGPEQIWQEIDALLASRQFDEYLCRLRLPGEKVVVFDLERRSFSVYRDPAITGLLKQGSYPGTRTRVYVLKENAEIDEVDVYNYLYCVGAVGMDCSGFIYYIQRAVAACLGFDLDAELAGVLGTAPRQIPQVVGLWLFNPQFLHATQAPHVVDALRPGDVFLFRGQVPGRGLDFRHSAVIQAVDPGEGLIRYLQCTDWAPQAERGVHESCIRYDPQDPQVSLKEPSVAWSQDIHPTFPGEPGLRYWRNDGDRFRSYMEADGSLVVRLDLVSRLLESRDPDYYRRMEPPEPPGAAEQSGVGVGDALQQ